ncbi:unnamed protein product [Cyclocybe aegerita]|uniref:pyranose dehydrogenase (acceptor) n=1 Tax=Cyclocybe aegerita TaxID=1973307 RepID=A0A8S0VQ25_CYCAE|nr:unnamed protein product [Cyclocybe aegerita]
MALTRFSVLALLALSAIVQAGVYQRFSDIQNVKFDFVVVGGGTAGNVLANRLTENPKFNVLVLEAGPSHDGVLDAQVPFLAGNLWNTPYDWNYTTTPQSALQGRTVVYPRGHILGGSSSINFMIYTRGPSSQYDDYARIVGDPGWSWNRLQPYFRRNERWVEPADRHDTRGQFDPSIHSKKGINAVSLAGFPTPVDGMIVGAAKQLGGDYRYNLDYSSGNMLGIGWVQTTIDGASRSSSATSYLGSRYLGRRNLYVVLNAQVSKLVHTSGTRVPAFRGVEFRENGGGPLKRVTATKEVLLCAGAIGSPHILLNSGIGDAKALKSIGVRSIVNLPDVGRHLGDHVATANPWIVNGNQTFETLKEPDESAEFLQQWKQNGTGPFVNTIVSHLGFFRAKGSPKSSNTPEYEFLISNGLIIPNPLVPSGRNFFTIVTALMTPKSTGSVRLRSSNPFDAPLVDPGFLKDKSDVDLLKESIKSAFKFVAAPTWSKYIVAPTGGLESTNTDAGLEDFILNNAGTFFHPTSSAKMSKKGAKDGVVDPDLKVKNVDGLRVVDASIFPYIFGAHPQAAVYVYAERASDLIKAAYSA